MEELVRNKLFLVIIIVGVIGCGVVFGGNLIMEKMVDKVIERLEKNYSPSPYGPGFDPDKVDMDVFKQRVIFEENTPYNVRMDFMGDDDWEENWERSRGFNLEQ